jgi:hypothetical protein
MDMAGPLRITFPAAFYHVTSRGNERKAVFRSKRDREKFLEYLESATNRYRAVVHAFWLMRLWINENQAERQGAGRWEKRSNLNGL